ncbi:heterokaryon incompatibility protein-domain-containing protein [Microdochium bolleyi]|uniref:Heterokaryon incompatibility protein-domain-containing protein n=1 Tax=Microdochium bolleyi TaxID=196109 RepID=A0A136J037_9PEZI|nr:heterokaryon incompatibility protein-domain-containing protein [Microdochium bolleyi]
MAEPPAALAPAQPDDKPSTYRYTSLDTSARSIRLLRLNSNKGPVKCELVTQQLEHGAFTPYEAVSYVWGPPDLCETISVSGVDMPVTASLIRMLQDLRERRHEYLWIDAICIDQANTAERNHQVQQMGQIYRSARRVIFYLGESTFRINVLMQSLWKLQMGSRRGSTRPTNNNHHEKRHVPNRGRKASGRRFN